MTKLSDMLKPCACKWIHGFRKHYSCSTPQLFHELPFHAIYAKAAALHGAWARGRVSARVSITKTDWAHHKRHPEICGAPYWWRPQASQEMFWGQTPACVFAYNEAMASVTFSGHGGKCLSGLSKTLLQWVKRRSDLTKLCKPFAASCFAVLDPRIQRRADFPCHDETMWRLPPVSFLNAAILRLEIPLRQQAAVNMWHLSGESLTLLNGHKQGNRIPTCIRHMFNQTERIPSFP